MFSTKLAGVPSFTICPQYEGGYKKKLLQDKYELTPTDVRKFKYPKDLNNSRIFFEEITYNITEFIRSIQVVTSKQNFKLDSTNSYRYETFFKETNWLSFGRCFTLELPKNQTVFTSLLSLLFTMKQKYFHRYRNCKLSQQSETMFMSIIKVNSFI